METSTGITLLARRAIDQREQISTSLAYWIWLPVIWSYWFICNFPAEDGWTEEWWEAAERSLLEVRQRPVVIKLLPFLTQIWPFD